MNRSKSVQQQNQDIMDCILPVTSLMFSGKQFKVYGTNEEPLFLVNDIVCVLLNARDIYDNQFFRDSKQNPKYT